MECLGLEVAANVVWSPGGKYWLEIDLGSLGYWRYLTPSKCIGDLSRGGAVQSEDLRAEPWGTLTCKGIRYRKKEVSPLAWCMSSQRWGIIREWYHGRQRPRIFEKEWPALSSKIRIETHPLEWGHFALGDFGQSHFRGVEGPEDRLEEWEIRKGRPTVLSRSLKGRR